jgi:ribosome-associated protein
MLNFALKTPYIELYKLLKVMGMIESGGMAKMVITDGLVTVDGDVEIRKARKIRAGQIVSFQGEEVLVEQVESLGSSPRL